MIMYRKSAMYNRLYFPIMPGAIYAVKGLPPLGKSYGLMAFWTAGDACPPVDSRMTSSTGKVTCSE